MPLKKENTSHIINYYYNIKKKYISNVNCGCKPKVQCNGNGDPIILNFFENIFRDVPKTSKQYIFQ